MCDAHASTMNPRIVWALCGAGLVLVACGGATTDGGDGGACSVRPLDGQRACVLGRAKANVALTLEADANGCTGCGSSMRPCKVTVAGNTIALALEESVCPLPPDTACAEACGVPKAKCDLPPLAPGSYAVEVAASVSVGGAVRRTLVVDANATGTACALDLAPPKDIAAADFSQSCTVPEDCIAVVQGAPCAPCACPSAAIAKTALADYEATVRERTSQCAPRLQPPCAACMPVMTTCVQNICGIAK